MFRSMHVHGAGGLIRISATRSSPMKKPKQFSADEARRIGDSLGIDWGHVDLEQFCMGLFVELEYGTKDPETNVTNDVMSLLPGRSRWLT
jgi:hypothetical protein